MITCYESTPTFLVSRADRDPCIERPAFASDANGNILTDAQGRSFTWDFENRLVQAVVTGQNGGTITFKDDPFGRRIRKSVDGCSSRSLFPFTSSEIILGLVRNAGSRSGLNAASVAFNAPPWLTTLSWIFTGSSRGNRLNRDVNRQQDDPFLFSF